MPAGGRDVHHAPAVFTVGNHHRTAQILLIVAVGGGGLQRSGGGAASARIKDRGIEYVRTKALVTEPADNLPGIDRRQKRDVTPLPPVHFDAHPPPGRKRTGDFF